MNKLLSWAFGSISASQGANAEAGQTCFDKECTQGTLPPAGQSPALTAHRVDPKVAEFFNDFPEPYRQKAIQRFSSREGLYRWDLFRTSDMQRERDYALKGNFLEDSREAEEQAMQKKEQERINDRAKLIRQFHQRQIPKWEEATLRVIPLQPGDSMPLKLFQSTSCAVSAALFLVHGVVDKKKPSLPKLRANAGLAAGICMFLCWNVIAVERLMDLQFFDRSVDERFWHEKLEDEVTGLFKPIYNLLKEAARDITSPP